MCRPKWQNYLSLESNSSHVPQKLGLRGRFVTLFFESWGVVMEESLTFVDLSLVRLGGMVCGGEVVREDGVRLVVDMCLLPKSIGMV